VKSQRCYRLLSKRKWPACPDIIGVAAASRGPPLSFLGSVDSQLGSNAHAASRRMTEIK
jgi:hypothetical protein